MNRPPTRSGAMLLALTCISGSRAGAQQIDFPSKSPVDRSVAIRVHGLSGGAIVGLRTALVDATGRQWAARAEFRADAGGNVDTGRDPSRSGTYRGVETAGLFNQMQAVGDTTGRLRFQTPGLSTLPTIIALEDSSGRVLDSLVVERFFLGPGVRIAPLTDTRLRGRLFVPARPGAPGIVVLGGSEGGFPDDLAALLATNGYFALSLAYFGGDSLPSELAEISLDYVGQAINWLKAQPGVWSDRIALVATSKGAEAALLVASQVAGVSAVVAYAPSSVAWSCICSEPARSSWTVGGKPVVAVPPGADPAYRRDAGEPLRPAVNYLYRLRETPPSAVIPVERIAGPLLLVAGGDDQLWPSLPMANAIMQRRALPKRHPDDQLLVYPQAGHLIGKAFVPAGSTRTGGGRLETGGTSAGNARAQADAWPRVLAFLAKALAR